MTSTNNISNKHESNQSKVKDLIEMGEFYFVNQKWDNAVEVLMKAKKIDPNNPDVYYNLGIVYEMKNQFEDAKQMLEKVLKIKPDHECAQRHLNKLVGT
ncbi:MAG: tetratricopeptide repeat protein [Deltaproteobacteria bacterium]|nr:tetratricopeptide repeat protein [Deltaproteobacteria bacterium]